jgi:LCP family protein required for cell wall assembly
VTTDPTTPRRVSTWRRAALALSLSFALLLGLGAVGGVLIYRHLNSNITVDHSADGDLGRSAMPSGSASASAAQELPPMNILVMGSDTRQGQSGIGGSSAIAGARSDVTMLVHLTANRKNAIVMSIPRDTWVTIPSCKQHNGSMSSVHDDKFNSAFSIGGPACTIKTFKQLTGIPVDHFIVIDFSGFERVINALGGVSVCLKQPIDDPVANHQGSGLKLSAGTHLLMGTQALEFARVRHNVSDGSDTSRILRQHAFLGALVKKVDETSLLTNPFQLYKVLDATTSSITADPGLASLGALKDLAQSLKSLKPKAVTFLTDPWHPRGDNANVLITDSKAKPIYDAINNDTPYPPPAVAIAGPLLKTSPDQISVEVLNATGSPGEAKKVAAELEALGFNIAGVATAPTVSATTVVHFAPSRNESGRTLTASVVGATSVSDSSLGATLDLYVGTDYTTVQRVAVTGSTSSTSTFRTAADSSCI